MAHSSCLESAMADQGIANPYFEDEDVAQIVIKPLSKYRGEVTPLG
jgi:hypothetical protein